MHPISTQVFLLWMLVMAVLLAVTHDYGPPPLSAEALVIYVVSVVLFYIIGAIIWLFTRIFARSSPSRMVTIYAYGFLAFGVAGEIWYAPMFQAAGIKAARLRGPLGALVSTPAPPVQTGTLPPAPPPVARRAPAAPPARNASSAATAAPATPPPGCERREDSDRNHITITCR